jgi:hypothetical protein
MTDDDDQPRYSGETLMAAALYAIERSRVHALSIRILIRRLGQRDQFAEEMDGRDPDVQALIQMIERSGVETPPPLNA